MSVKITCPNCGFVLHLPDDRLLGRKARCPGCRVQFTLQAPASPPPETETPPPPPPPPNPQPRSISQPPSSDPVVPTQPTPPSSPADSTSRESLPSWRASDSGPLSKAQRSSSTSSADSVSSSSASDSSLASASGSADAYETIETPDFVSPDSQSSAGALSRLGERSHDPPPPLERTEITPARPPAPSLSVAAKPPHEPTLKVPVIRRPKIPVAREDRVAAWDGDYARPHQKWVCGRAAEGNPCHLGPDPRGRCHAMSECLPLYQEGRWYCVRPKENGGPCQFGPLPDGTCSRPIAPCQPALNQRSRRGQWSMAALALTLSLIIYFLSDPQSRRRLINPGELAAPHAALFSNTLPSGTPGAAAPAASANTPVTAAATDRQCAVCHPMASQDFLAQLFQHSGEERAALQDVQCLKCHSLGDYSPNPHSLNPALLRKLTAEHSTPGPHSNTRASLLVEAAHWLGLDGSSRQQSSRMPLHCAACHHEHRGLNVNLSEITNERCQSCHARRFDSFQHGHPEFSNDRTARRTPIFFDHESHFGRHFRREFACTNCHALDAQGRYMLVQNFETSCAECHGKQITDDFRDGLAILVVPGLDLDALKAEGIDIGEWPREARGKLSPFMELLLPTDAETAEIYRTAKAVPDLLLLADAGPEQLESVQWLAWSVKELLYDLLTQGERHLISRLQARLKSEHPETFAAPLDLSPLTDRLSIDTIRRAQERWFPNLMREVAARRGVADAPPATTAAIPLDPPLVGRAVRGWYRNDRTLALDYRPTGHADAALRVWYELCQRYAPHADWATGIFQRRLGDPASRGACLKCHSVDALPDGRFQVNWKPARSEPGPPEFTRFAHRPHVAQAPLAGSQVCANCHALQKKRTTGELSAQQQFYYTDGGPLETNPHQFASNFAQIKKQTCVECHTSRRAGDNCVMCHNYHITQPAPAPNNPPLATWQEPKK